MAALSAIELNVADDPIEDGRGAGDVVEAVALRPARDVAEPNRLLQQPAFVRLDRRSRPSAVRRDQRREPVVLGEFGVERREQRIGRPLRFSAGSAASTG